MPGSGGVGEDPGHPGRPQLAATIGVLPLNAAAVSPVTPQARPAGVAFRELTVASRLHVAPSRRPSSALVPPLVSAMSWPFGPAASASAALARLAFSGPAEDHFAPLSVLAASGV